MHLVDGLDGAQHLRRIEHQCAILREPVIEPERELDLREVVDVVEVGDQVPGLDVARLGGGEGQENDR